MSAADPEYIAFVTPSIGGRRLETKFSDVTAIGQSAEGIVAARGDEDDLHSAIRRHDFEFDDDGGAGCRNDIEHRDPRLGLRLEPVPVEKLAFQRGEEALAHGIVVGVSDRPIEGRTPVSRQR